jgi:HAMP domain-containing protein
VNTVTVVAITGALAAVISALVAVLLLMFQVRSQNRTIQRQNEEQLRKQRIFESDWNGEPARPGVPGRAGIMERVAAIEGELKPNGGGSLRDSVNRLEREQIRQRTQLTDYLDGHPKKETHGPESTP